MDYYEAIEACIIRYKQLLEDVFPSCEDLNKFCDEIIDNCKSKNYPLNKLNRHLGYIQGVLIENGHTTVTIERDWTRPLFRPLDFP